MPTRLANQGYWAMSKETTKGVIAAIPSVFVPIYSESFTTDLHPDEDNPIVGNKYEIFQMLMGMRSHGGDATLMAEPNTAARILDMLYNKTGTAGSNPYTHSFALNDTNPNSYTVDICKGQVVHRFLGVECGELGNDFDENKMVFNGSFSALKSFTARGVASVSTNIVTLDTLYDPTPADGLFVGDLIRVFLTNGTTLDTTVTAVGGTTVTLASTTGVTAGAIITLRKQTASFVNVTPFMKARTEYRFANNASAALSATQTRLDEATWTLTHNFEDGEGAKRTGSFDPDELVRTQGRVSLDNRIRYDTPENYNRFLTLAKQGLVIRHFSESGYELRLTINNLKFAEYPIEQSSGDPVYAEPPAVAVYDGTDAQAFDVKVINAIASI